MKSLILITLGPSPLRIVQSEWLSNDEEDFLANYALPFGSDWNRFTGARAFKVFPVREDSVCMSYTVIRLSENQRQNGLCCLATLADNEAADRLLSESPYWVKPVFSPLVDRVQDRDLADILRRRLQVPPPDERPRLRFRHWCWAQLHMRIQLRWEFRDLRQWQSREEYVRQAFSATRWQRQFLRFLVTSPRMPSFSTFATSASEFTQITSLPYPVRGRKATPSRNVGLIYS
jgi:hypothetical protein